MNRREIEDIILVEVLEFKKPERAGDYCRARAAAATDRILALIAPTPLVDEEHGVTK